MTIKIETEFAVIACITCGIEFAVSVGYQERLMGNHRTFYCPNGHSHYYPQKNKEEQLRDELAQAEEATYLEREARHKAEKKLDGALDRITKLKKRADA
ncbi:hypothetical protein LCGC14_1816730, partial [marine sediment metagenome]